MESSTNVKSLVRGWLQASPNIGRIKLAPSPLPSTFSPRPERLGLGAVPPADTAAHVYNKQLERRIQRKVVGKRISAEIGCSPGEKGACCGLSDEECSRSASVHHKTHSLVMDGARNSAVKNKRKRKKKKKENALNSVSTSLVSNCSPTVHTVADEDPLPQRRDLLRGGSLQGLETVAFNTKYATSVKPSEDCGSDHTAGEKDGKTCSERQVVFSKSVSLLHSCESTLKKTKKRKCHHNRRCGWRHIQRGQSLPWSWKSLRHRPRRQHCGLPQRSL